MLVLRKRDWESILTAGLYVKCSVNNVTSELAGALIVRARIAIVEAVCAGKTFLRGRSRGPIMARVFDCNASQLCIARGVTCNEVLCCTCFHAVEC